MPCPSGPTEGSLQHCDADDGFVASLRTSNGVTAVIDCSLETPVSTPERTAVFADGLACAKVMDRMGRSA